MLGGRVHTAADAARVLARQISNPSRWDAVLRAIADTGVARFLEVGPGDVLTKLVRWTVRSARGWVAEDPDSIAAFAASAGVTPRGTGLSADIA
jgi:[acyl-carrier-protein] S-malonyltransferase